VHKSGLIHLQNDNIHLQTVLFDSGAIQSNYIDEQFVNDNIVHLQPFLQPLKHSVKLGDNKTQLQLSHIITITFSFIDSTLKSHEATINCSLMPISCPRGLYGPEVRFWRTKSEDSIAE
jgi:hypothetical protein